MPGRRPSAASTRSARRTEAPCKARSKAPSTIPAGARAGELSPGRQIRRRGQPLPCKPARAMSSGLTTRGAPGQPRTPMPRGQTVTSPPARYLQYQAVLSGDAAGNGPQAARCQRLLSAAQPCPGRECRQARRRRRRFQVRSASVVRQRPRQRHAGLRCRLFRRRRQDLDADQETRRARRGQAESATASTPAESQANLDKQTNLPPAVRAQIMAQIKAKRHRRRRRRRTEVDAKAAGGATGLKETSFSWDTTEVPDGTYQIRVTASDKPSNPDGSLTAKAVSAPFLIANAVPTLTTEAPLVARRQDGDAARAGDDTDGLCQSASRPKWTAETPSPPRRMTACSTRSPKPFTLTLPASHFGQACDGSADCGPGGQFGHANYRHHGSVTNAETRNPVKGPALPVPGLKSARPQCRNAGLDQTDCLHPVDLGLRTGDPLTRMPMPALFRTEPRRSARAAPMVAVAPKSIRAGPVPASFARLYFWPWIHAPLHSACQCDPQDFDERIVRQGNAFDSLGTVQGEAIAIDVKGPGIF